MAKRLSDEQWLEIRTKYELGGAIRAIAREFDIPHGTIQARIRKENWVQNLASQVSEIKTKIQEISQVANPAQMVAIEQEITDAMQIAKSITNLQKGALNLHNIVIKKTIDGVQAGKLGVKEASQVLANTGLKVDQIHKMNNPDGPQTQVNIQNNNSATAIVEDVKKTVEDLKEMF